MKVLVFIVILLGIIFTYSAIDEFAKGDRASGVLGWGNKVERTESTPKTYYYRSSETSATTTTPTTNTQPNYTGKVEIYGVNKATNQHPSLIKIKVRPNKGEPINFTGWTINTIKGTFAVPQGLEVYQKNGTPSDIIVKETSYLNLVGDSSPLGTKKNFRGNKCLPYFSKSEDLYPRTYSRCETPKLEDLTGFSPYCKEYLINQRGCEMPNYSVDFKISTDSACVSYILNYFTYKGCVDRYSKEDKFLSNDWYIYVNKNIVEELHDTVRLYNQNSQLVDEFIY